jgi:hypothetical protein
LRRLISRFLTTFRGLFVTPVSEKEKELIGLWESIPKFYHMLGQVDNLEQELEISCTLFKVMCPSLKKQIHVLRERQSEEDFMSEFGKAFLTLDLTLKKEITIKKLKNLQIKLVDKKLLVLKEEMRL